MSLLRLDKYLADVGCGTRTEVKKIIKTGAVLVNGEIVKDGSVKVNTDDDAVICQGRTLTFSRYHYIMLHKPAGCVTATKDNVHATVMDYLPKDLHKNLAPVGRLDLDTEGLLLITDHGELAHRLLSPSHHIPKTYYTRVVGEFREESIAQFAKGIDIGEDKLTRPAILEILSPTEGKITIIEGKFHQVKRMCAAVGCEVIYLKRLSMGSLTLDEGLALGEWRYLTKEEEEYLLSC